MANIVPHALGPTPKRSATPIVLGIVGVVSVILLLWSCVAGSASKPDEPPTMSEVRFMAIDTCHEAVTNQLKAPATAKFTNDEAKLAEGGWTVTGSVDSENSFGALIRSSYTCTARLDGDTMRARAQVSEP